jgi:protein gp37
MGDRTSIEWTRGDDGSAGATWNPIRGTVGRWACTRVSPGCDSCYAARLNVRFGGPDYAQPGQPLNDTLRFDEKALLQPLSWRSPRRIFVCSMTDLFHESVPDEWLDRIFGVTALAPQHTFMCLTKRPKRMREYVKKRGQYPVWNPIHSRMSEIAREHNRPWQDVDWPLPNVWLGTSIELDRYSWRANLLRETPAAVRFISAEPLLGHLDSLDLTDIDWLIAGGESGGAEDRRLVEPCSNMDFQGYRAEGRKPHGTACPGCGGTQLQPKAEAWIWVSKLRDAAARSGTAFFLKQWGGARPASGGRLLDGREWSEMPGRVAVTA